jgi:hypothetical protein
MFVVIPSIRQARGALPLLTVLVVAALAAAAGQGGAAAIASVPPLALHWLWPGPPVVRGTASGQPLPG